MKSKSSLENDFQIDLQSCLGVIMLFEAVESSKATEEPEGTDRMVEVFGLLIRGDCLWNKAAAEIRFKRAPVVFKLEARFLQTGNREPADEDQLVLAVLSGSHLLQLIRLESRVAVKQIRAVVLVLNGAVQIGMKLFANSEHVHVVAEVSVI